jgi:hypothetical protein
MWTCPKCNEVLSDDVKSCWKCAAVSPSVRPPPAPLSGAPPKEPSKENKNLDLVAMIFLMMGVMPGILMVTNGGIHNRAQAFFRLTMSLIGLSGYAAVKMYQRNRMKGKK